MVVLKVPILGLIIGKGSIARFTRTLGTLISAGVPILDAINITKETCGNEVYARALSKVLKGDKTWPEVQLAKLQQEALER